jgi:hypothetical protein
MAQLKCRTRLKRGDLKKITSCASRRRCRRPQPCTGHGLQDVEAIRDAHYFDHDIQLAEATVLKLEKRTKL